ncbi:MAG: hypothetical protein ACYSUT_04540 [Planctomycetota bacterium]
MTTDTLQIAERSLNWAADRDYRGYSKFDALNSPFLRLLSCKSVFLRKAFVFAVSRMPVNLRPLLGVQKKQNPKGLALFARAYLNLHTLTGNADYKARAEKLLAGLLEISQIDKFSGHCWGYEHPWQNIAFFIPPYEPNSVVTCAAAEAFLKAYQLFGQQEHLDVCESVARFLLDDLTQIDVGTGRQCRSYDLRSDWKVINVNAFIAAYLAKLYAVTDNERYKTVAVETMRWVIDQKTDECAWYYTDPPEASRITIDNYHTGFVLDAIQEYMEVFENDEYQEVWETGLTYYQKNLFASEHAPKWMYNRPQPHDIHGAAQGIITFSKASVKEPDLLGEAQTILDWTLENLYDPSQSRFYYQKTKRWTKRFTLMRWSQAWMCYAMSEYLSYIKKQES